MRNLIARLSVIIVFIGIVATVIAYARGYRLDLNKKTVTPTGILAVSSSPKAAKIYVNGELKGATDTNLTLPPGQYQVDIKKEGYSTWSKSVKLKGELVVSLDALLFPVNPSLSPLTNLGVVKALPVDQTDQVILFSDNKDPLKDGIYMFEVNQKPLSFFPPLKLIILKKNLPGFEQINFSDTKVYYSPDYKQAIFEFSADVPNVYNPNIINKQDAGSYLLSLDGDNTNPFDISKSKETLLEAWAQQQSKNDLKILETFPKEISKIATDSFQIVSVSPDESKILYVSKKSLSLPLVIDPPMIATNQTTEDRNLIYNNLYLYDKKEDKNYRISVLDNNDGYRSMISSLNSKGTSASILENYILWYSDSRHLLFKELIPTTGRSQVRKEKLSIIDYDGNNKQTVYSGPFESSFFTTTSDGKAIVLANLNPESNPLPDMYLVGIR